MILTYDMAVASAEKVMARLGKDFVYNPGGHGGCFYDTFDKVAAVATKTDEIWARVQEETINPNADITGCLVGEILKDNNLLTDSIRISVGTPIALCKDGLLNATEKAALFLASLQGYQDRGETWWYSFAHAVSEASHYPETLVEDEQ